mmetsp:Transcript_74628/g.148296  ORF Transcript_74628/g.148296 Transcript_74628/m.148296 type:complete len:135 (-) Transcript_74628:177-581(-)
MSVTSWLMQEGHMVALIPDQANMQRTILGVGVRRSACPCRLPPLTPRATLLVLDSLLPVSKASNLVLVAPSLIVVLIVFLLACLLGMLPFLEHFLARGTERCEARHTLARRIARSPIRSHVVGRRDHARVECLK